MTSGVQPTRLSFKLSYFPVCYTMVTELPRRSAVGSMARPRACSPCVGSEICEDFLACYTKVTELPRSPSANSKS